MSKEITIYTSSSCSLCTSAKALLGARGLEYNEVLLSADSEGRAKLAAETGLMTFPQIVIGTELLGGFRELAQADADGKLEALVSS